MKIDYFNPPQEDLVTLLNYFPRDSFLILEDVLETPKTFKYVFQKMIDIMKHAFEVEEIRHYEVHFKFKHDDIKIHILPMNKFIFSMVFWYGFMDMDRVDLLTEKYLIDVPSMNLATQIKWIDENICAQHPGDIFSKNKTIDEIRHNSAAIARAFSELMGLSVSIRDIIFAEKRNPRLHELMNLKIDESMQPSEIERFMSEKADELIDILTREKTGLQPLMLSGKNLSKGQIREIMMTIGLKSDINGHTIPVIVNTNFLVDGLYKPSYQVTSAKGARKALILSKKYMSVPGTFSKKINLSSTSPSILREDNEICDSVTTIDYDIHDENFLRLLDKRYYYDSIGVMRLLDYASKDTRSLIGKKVRFRSPCTCNGDKVCRYCYGTLYDINKDLFSAGSFAATKQSEPLGQKVLGSKHEQNTKSDHLSFNADFDNFLELSSTEITLNENLDDMDNLSILLDNVDVEEIGDEEYFFTSNFKILDESTGVIYNIQETNKSRLYLSSHLVSIYKKMKDKTKPISLSLFSEDGDIPLFIVEVESAEVTEPIRVIERVLNKTAGSTISEICQATAEAFISIGINYNLVHAEMIIRSLIRRKSDTNLRPDFSRTGNHNDVQVLNINMSLKQNPSALVCLSYGYVKQQLVSPQWYQKSAPSHLDALWVDKLSDYIDQ